MTNQALQEIFEGVIPVIEMLPQEGAHVRLIGRVGQAARADGHEDAYRTWLRLRNADSEGRARVAIEGISPDVLTVGEGVFWHRYDCSGFIYLRSPRRVMEAFEALALARVDVAAVF